MNASVAIKGTKSGLVVTLAEGPSLDSVVAELTGRLKQGAAFFADARLTLNVGLRPVTAAEWQGLRDLLLSHGVTLQSVIATSEAGRQGARAAGLAVISPVTAAQMTRAESRSPAAAREEHNGMLIKRTLRSGVSIRHPSHVVLLGDLHAGAEIIAGGDIVVWGALRGIAHAGALGDETAGIYALHLAPTQLRIAGHVARPPELTGDQSWPEAARVQDGQIVVEAWSRAK
jgi:septum site-determining protein MinC